MSSRSRCISHGLTPRQAPAELSLVSLGLAEPAATAAQGLQVVCEGTNLIVEYASSLLGCALNS